MGKFLDSIGVSFLYNKIKSKLNGKVDKIEGKGLSTNDFTDEDKAKLDRFELILANDDEIEDGLHQIALSEDYSSKLKENGYVVYHDVKYKVKDCGVDSNSYPWIITEGAVITANEDGTLNDHTQENIARSVYIWFDTILHYQPYNTIIPSKVSELQNDLKYQTEAQLANSIAIAYESLDAQLVDEYTHLDNKKVDKVEGKQLSTEDFTSTEKNKLKDIEEGANNYTLPTASGSTKGGVKVGDRLALDGEVLSAEEQIKWRTIE